MDAQAHPADADAVVAERVDVVGVRGLRQRPMHVAEGTLDQGLGGRRQGVRLHHALRCGRAGTRHRDSHFVYRPTRQLARQGGIAQHGCDASAYPQAVIMLHLEAKRAVQQRQDVLVDLHHFVLALHSKYHWLNRRRRRSEAPVVSPVLPASGAPA